MEPRLRRCRPGSKLGRELEARHDELTRTRWLLKDKISHYLKFGV